MEPIKEEWMEWKCNPCTKQLMIELGNERQGLIGVLIKSRKEDFDRMQGQIGEVDFVIRHINEKGE